MTPEKREAAIKWLKWEIRSLERAPEINGCPMTKDWAEQLEIMKTCLEAVTVSHLAHIDREAWAAEWIKYDGYTECSKCGHWYDSPDSEDDGDRPAFCPSCGRAMTPAAWAELEKRVRG